MKCVFTVTGTAEVSSVADLENQLKKALFAIDSEVEVDVDEEEEEEEEEER